MKTRRLLLSALLLTAAATSARADLKNGAVDLKAPGPLAFGPNNVLFVGDLASATIYAIDTRDEARGDRDSALNVDKVDARIGEMVGSSAKDVKINDMKVNPATGNVFFSVAKSGAGLIVKIDRGGKMTELDLKDVPCATLALSNPAAGNKRNLSITSLAFAKGKLFIAGLSNEEFASTLRSVEFPFKESDKGTSVEIFHGAHGRWETASPVRTFTTFDIDGQTNLLAAYTCTPLVKFPLDTLKPGEKVKGVTVAELGNMNTPLDMVVYQKEGKTFILIANTARGVMKVTADGLDKAEGITKPIRGTAGLKYETVGDLKGVMQLDRLGANSALLLVKADDSLNLKTVALP